MISSLASLALDGCLPSNYNFNEVKSMKVKSTFYTRRFGVDFDPVIKVSYPKSRADQLSFTPTAKLVDQMFRTGQMVQSSKALYDFPDGKDDGRDVPIDRMRGLDYPEISQMMADNESKLESHEKAIKAMAKSNKVAGSAEASAAEGSDGANVVSDGADVGRKA